MKQIIAMGGGGFSQEPDNPAMDQYILKQSGKERPRVCFLPTASAESQEYIIKFYVAFSQLGCQPSHLSLFHPPTKDMRGFILEKDIIYVGGGNTRSMLALWREWDLNNILLEAYQNGVVLAGISAGGNCWFEQCTTDAVPGEIGMLPALGYLSGSFSPHYNTEAERRPALHQLLKENAILPGYAVDESAAIHFIDGNLHKAIRSIPEVQAFHVSFQNNEIIETSLEMHDA
ncbi:MAG: peptidase E [Anaerolineaceae bacterium]|nr:peptidase E [Anaerolineaceae bacterium]